MEGLNIVASELAEFEQLVVVFRRIMERLERRIQEMMDVKIAQIMKDCVRKLVKEEIQSGESSKSTKKRMLAGHKRTNANAETLLNKRSLQLRFVDEVSDVVLTGKEIKGKGGAPIRLEIVDGVTKQIIESGPESSTKVEILCLDAHENDKEHNWTHEDFNSRIITESDKMKPQFAKRYHAFLDKGIGVLSNAKLAQYSNWTKASKCRLGARVVENLYGVEVKEAWTKPFLVSDSRGMLYAKRYPPSLSDEVWRLDNIGRGGEPCKRLKENNILTVKDLLFLNTVDTQRLQQILAVSERTWKVIENHAQTCNINDTRIYMYNDSSEGNLSVVFDAVGSLKGLIHNSQYVVESCLSEAEKDRARELLCSAFENRKHIVSFDDELTLVQQYPYRASNAAVNASNQKSFHDIDLDMSENEDLAEATDTILSIGRSFGSSVSENNKTVMHQIPP